MGESRSLLCRNGGDQCRCCDCRSLAHRLSLDFELGLDLPIDNTREMAARLLSMMEGKEIAGIDLSEDDSGAGFYV
ncbi:MAG: hypothetical protein Ct9H90mP16_09270 [Candidatus Poseidoniales archaeon]|nr:MAG: hypothetical protein Ct9H90mP16_09270 [Candidatus Poseidoniales archaeon]